MQSTVVDTLVPIDNSRRILVSLQEQKVPSELVELPGVGHAPSGEQMKKLAESIERAVAWFDKYMKERKTVEAGAAGQ